MTFQIHALPYADFAPLFGASDETLSTMGICRVIADAKPCFPCRVSLQDAEIGDEVLLLNHHHLKANTPYAASHAIYVRKSAVQAQPASDEVPTAIAIRLLSVRAYDADQQMVMADVTDGKDLVPLLHAFFANAAVSFVHLHHAKQGCFAASVTRTQLAYRK